MQEITAAATIENISPVTDFVNEQLETMGCPLEHQLRLDMAVDEVLNNIASYAYTPGSGTVTVRVEQTEDPPGVELTFIDGGKPFNPLLCDDPDTTLGAEERGIGGLGIFLVKKTMDLVRYKYEGGRNILTVRKIFG